MQVTRFIMGKGGSPMCGDALYVGEHFLAVIDGATPKGGLRWEDMPGDMFVSHFLAGQLDTIAPDICADEAISTLNCALADYYADCGRLNLPVEEMLQASLVIYSVARRQIWSFGDCQFMVNGVLGSRKKRIDEVLAAARSLWLATELRYGKSVRQLRKEDTGRAFILPLLRRQGYLMNSDDEYGYPVLCGGRYREEDIRIIPVGSGDSVVLASDGYPVLCPTLEESERRLAEIIDEDPLMMSLSRETKGVMLGNVSYDDRSYLGFVVP